MLKHRDYFCLQNYELHLNWRDVFLLGVFVLFVFLFVFCIHTNKCMGGGSVNCLCTSEIKHVIVSVSGNLYIVKQGCFVVLINARFHCN